MKNLFSNLIVVMALSFMIGCSSDDGGTPTSTDFDAPTVSAPTISNQPFDAAGVSVSFTVSVDADLTASWTASSTGGITLSSTSGEISGTSVDLTFDATASGAASITVTVMDSEGQMANATAVFEVEEEQNTISVTSNIT
ncbi:MAG: hypothetical protein HKN76_12390, partial [Saprospiraceae bacterium]|nr:hypothetical protein [Saprospiraceae bacterium]